jgi:hypothetical protein
MMVVLKTTSSPYPREPLMRNLTKQEQALYRRLKGEQARETSGQSEDTWSHVVLICEIALIMLDMMYLNSPPKNRPE